MDVRRTAFVGNRRRTLQAEAAGVVRYDGRAARAQVLATPIRLPQVNPGAPERLAVDRGEDDAVEDVPGADLAPSRRCTTAERPRAVVQRRRATGRRGRGGSAAGSESGESESGGAREQPHA